MAKRRAKYRHLSHGFAPVFDERSRVLVLGSFPSELSREHGFYYGNPLNRFWRVLACVADAPEPQSIEEKRAFLLSHGVALWDAIEECDIRGSADSSIKNVVPARIERVLSRSPIERVVCNGATAGRLYKRYLQWKVGITADVLPSTSPANAAWSLERLCERWTEVLGSLPELGEAPEAGRVPEPRDVPELNKGDDENESGDEHVEGNDGKSSGTEYAVVPIAPAASSYAVHRSMQGNKCKDTKPELLVRKRLREAGLTGYRLQWKVPGRPDVAWPGKKVCILINGCFWHRCPHCSPSMPKKNVEYWALKFERNVERDERNLAALAADGWRVHVIWECELKKDREQATFAKLLSELSAELGKPLLDVGVVP